MIVYLMCDVLLVICGLSTLSLSQTAPVTLIDEDFETSTLGGFTQSQIEEYDWQWRTGRNHMHVNGPAVDHSTTTSTGHFMFVNTVSWRPGSKAELYSPTQPASGTNRCVRYFYYMTGISPGTLNIRVRSGIGINMTSVVVGKQSGDKGQEWNRGLASLPPIEREYKITFEATSDGAIGGEIAIDDVQLLNSPCPEDELSCSFESPDLCGFIQDPTDDGDLVHASGKTDSFYTGPSYDHTFQNASGHYVFMEATPLGRNQKVRLITPTLRGVPSNKESHCLVFWYHMFGMAVDSLSIYLLDVTQEVSTLASEEPQWILRGNRGNLWRATEVSITARTDYKIVFEFSRGVRYDGDIAIDDVIVTSYACPGKHVYANVSSVSCEFEEADICHYVQDRSKDTEDWQWGNGQTYVDFTGPSVDHTRGDELGFYLFFERSVSGGDDARISSPPIKSQRASSCVEFYYHMYGTDVNALIVYINRPEGDFPDRQVWNMTGNQGDKWHRAELIVPASLYPLHLVFHAIGGTAFRDNIAIDDIRLFEGSPCPEVSTDTPIEEPTPPLIHDLECTFENGWCNLTQETTDIFDWKLGQGQDTNQNIENMVDHTYANTTGHYAFIDTSQRFLRTNDKARLRTSIIGPSPSPRCFTFRYFMSSPNADFLNIYVVPYGGTESFDPQFVVYGTQEAKWLKAQIAMEPSMTSAVYVVIEGVVGKLSNLADIAIDDVRLENNACSVPETKPTGLPLTANCDFELDRGCGYIQATNDDFDWIRHRGRTDTADTGPLVDHTVGTAEGFYFYAEASQPQRPGDRAAFLIPPIAGNNQPMCLRFFYHMNGVDSGSLRISIVLPGHQTGSAGLEILRLYGQKMTSWLPSNIDVIEVDGPLQIRFEAVIGKSFRSDIAIDDISFLRRPCDGLPSESLCDFEKGLHDCNYHESGGPSIYFQWSWYDSTTPSTPALQMIDSLTEGGTRDSFLFLIVGDKPVTSGSTTNISSPFLSAVSPYVGHCVDLNYAVTGSGELELSVFVESENGSSALLRKFEISGKWSRASIPLKTDNYFNPFKITFVAQLNEKIDTDIEAIAIDDIAITVGACKSSKKLQIDGKHIPVLALALLLAISLLALIVVCILWLRRRHRSSLPVMLLQRRHSDEHTMSLTNGDSMLDTTATSIDEYRS